MKSYQEEAAAWDKFCPNALSSDTGTSGRCWGAHCMAWRWVRTNINNPDDPTGDLIPSDDTYGFCGMAGVPKE